MDRHTNAHMETKSKYFDRHGRFSQSEESECICSLLIEKIKSAVQRDCIEKAKNVNDSKIWMNIEKQDKIFHGLQKMGAVVGFRMFTTMTI